MSGSAEGYTPQPMVPRARRAVAARGLRPVLGDFARWGVGVASGLAGGAEREGEEFTFAGDAYRYLHHPYNFTWMTERAVEVPIARAAVARHAGRRILEVGHVLGHYGATDHTVVDKYEQADGVLNRDVLDLAPLGEFDLVVAVSTVEHVGWDEEPRDPEKAVAVVHALRDRLASGGTLLLTVPVGYHPHLDAALAAGAVPFEKVGALRRERAGPHWREVAPADAWGTPYDFLLYSARAVVVAEIGAG